MKGIIFAIDVVAVLCLFETTGSSVLTEIVQTDKGPVRGEVLKTVASSIEYSAFRGIPYGKPPIGYLRFKPPVEVDSWRDVLNATAEPNWCPQFRTSPKKLVGNEDCLYLNVYTPKTKFNTIDDELLAVMVWIYGGGFYEGTCTSSIYGPDFLIEDNVIVVTMNYRLGALGFLSLNHKNATGNAAMKDQVLALKWVQKNIKNFGGNPTGVTIFGQSAGAASVELHKVSNLSKGLFNRSIAMSGSALNPWALGSIKAAVSNAFAMGQKLGFATTSADELLEKLYNATVDELVSATFEMITMTDMPFKPTIEDEKIAGKEAFLTECAIRRYKSGNFEELPHIMGFVEAEAIAVGSNVTYSTVNSAAMDETSQREESNSSSSSTSETLDSSENNRLKKKKSIPTEVRIASDLFFILGIDRTQQYLSKGTAPIYYYRNCFDHDAALHKLAGITINGCMIILFRRPRATGHSDDITHIFYISERNQSLDTASDIGIHRKKMVRMFTNFAKYSNPTPKGDKLLNITWTPSGVEGHHLEIGNHGFAMAPRPIDNFVKVLEKFLKPVEEYLNGCFS